MAEEELATPHQRDGSVTVESESLRKGALIVIEQLEGGICCQNCRGLADVAFPGTRSGPPMLLTK